jgi:tetratricopeptide (TPR) repeat protein
VISFDTALDGNGARGRNFFVRILSWVCSETGLMFHNIRDRGLGPLLTFNRLGMHWLIPVLFAALLPMPSVMAQNVRAQDHANLGISLARAGKLPEAEQELQEAVHGAPEVALYRAQLASILGLQGKWKEALESFQRAVDLDPGNIDFRRETAAVQWQLGLMSSAEKNLNYVLEKHPGDPGAVLLLGLVSEKKGDYRTAAQLLDSQFDQVISQADRTVALFNSWVQSGQRGNLAKIVDVLKLRTNDPAWASAISRCTQIAAIGGDLETAQSLFALIPANEPSRPVAGVQLAKLLYGHGQVSAAKQTLLQLAEQGVVSADLQALLGACFEAEHQPVLAQQAYQREIDMDPSRIDYYQDLISLLLDLGKTKDAAALVNRALMIAPDDARPWVWKAHVNLQANAYKDAIESYTHASKLDGSNADAMLGVATVDFVIGQNDAAIAEYKTGIEKFPDDARFYVGCAETLLASPDSRKLQAQAEKLLENAVKLAPQSAEAHYQLGQLALQQSRLNDAEKELLIAVQLEPNQSKSHFALSVLYRRMKRTDDAAKEFAIYRDLKGAEEGAKATAVAAGEKP